VGAIASIFVRVHPIRRAVQRAGRGFAQFAESH